MIKSGPVPKVEEFVTLTTKPSFRVIGLGSGLILLMGAGVYKISQFVSDDRTWPTVVIWVLVAFMIGCAIEVMFLKVITITKKDLIIYQPLLFRHEVISRDDIVNFREMEYEHEVSISTYNSITIYRGFRIILKIKNRKDLIIKSFDVSDYGLLVEKIGYDKRVGKSPNFYLFKYHGRGQVIFAWFFAAFGWAYAVFSPVI